MTYLYAAIAIGAAILGGLLMHLFDAGKLSHVEGQLKDLQAADWQGKADRLAVANKALSEALAKAQAASDNNAQVIHDLQTQTASIQADRNKLNSQLAWVLAHPPGPGSGGVPQGGDKPGTVTTTPDTGTNEVAGLLTDALTECRLNNADHYGLISQLKPQLGSNP